MNFKRRACQVLAVSACLAVLNGCAFLPPIVQQGYAVLSGISYLTTSKGPADHVLSLAMAKDCAPVRLLMGRSACLPVSENSNRPLVAMLIGVLHPQPVELPAEELFVEFAPPVDLRMPPAAAIAQTY